MRPALGRYKIEKELGRGATGIVYLGRDLKTNGQMAIKTTGLGLEGMRHSFREAELVSSLNHPSIVRILEVGEEAEIAFIAMEFLDGHNLGRYCGTDCLLSLETALDCCARTADGLDYAHQAGVFHRDIKPANIMLLQDGSLRITDFGVAQIASSSKTPIGTIMGTPAYMSPEQVSGKTVDGRSDLWSLGIVLYELSTGAMPFKGGADIGVLFSQILSDAPTPATDHKPGLPSEVVAIIEKCLKKNPDDRYQRGSDLATDLRETIARLKSGGPS